MSARTPSRLSFASHPSRLHRTFARLAAAVPSRCGICARWPAEPVCEACRLRFAQPLHRCARCALPVPAGVGECGACVKSPPPLDACFAAVPYDYPWSSLVAQFKFQGRAGWARSFARLVLDTPGVAQAVEDCDLVLPMPLARERLAERGFNQALALARCLAPARKVEPALLLRLANTPPQAALGRKERLANVRHAFGVEPLRLRDVRGRHVLVVDDVMTSGASLFAAAEALRRAGAASVGAVVFARTDEAD
ncbi:MAG TPA: ComF family protein [Ramlibacter sp.]|uniref:ComF family protein n=1 Tax=Ramlibacter sp. TaxID=1917967 RepID=UPI002CE1917C|nr:ComF family protein [Ramlibacter sp.]HVZ44535.1 ComF family protein [Ramlibacter sp.]